VIVVGVAGGIGSGKTAVTDVMGARGAIVIDADVIARDIVAPGSPCLEEIRSAFGDHVLHEDGSLNREALATIVFTDESARLQLNEITHPRINDEMKRQIALTHARDGVCLIAIPLLVSDHRERLGLDAIIVVDCPTEIALERLVTDRQFDRDHARSRIASQISREERNALGDYVVVNDGTRDQLERKIDDLWSVLLARTEAKARG
jgi:dephospho-CoA kinase